MTDEPLDLAAAREHLALIIHMIRREVEIAANAHAATRALTQALRDVFPERDAELAAAFAKHYAYEAKDGETAVTARRIIEELDKIFPHAKYGSA